MSASSMFRLPTRGRNATVGLMVPLWLAATVALGGCAPTANQHTASGARTAAAAGPEQQSCEQQHNLAVLQCRQTFDPLSSATFDQLSGCRAQALESYQGCRGP
jgi:hypothetical protein